jgi:hypothetical protein
MQHCVHHWLGGLRRHCAPLTTGNHLPTDMFTCALPFRRLSEVSGARSRQNIRGKSAEVRSTPRNLGSRLSRAPVSLPVVQPSPLTSGASSSPRRTVQKQINCAQSGFLLLLQPGCFSGHFGKHLVRRQKF